MEIDSSGASKRLKIKVGALLIIGGLTVAIVFLGGFFELSKNSAFSLANKILDGQSISATASNIITIYAAGTPANEVYPTMKLYINGVSVKTFKDIRGNPDKRIFNQYTYRHPSTLYGKNISVHFTNDATFKKQDRSLVVDKIVVGDVSHETETVSTLSTGTFDAINGCAPGYKMSEWLHCNGKFDYHPKDSFCKMFPLDAKCNVNKMNTINWNDSPFMHGDGRSFYFMDVTWDYWPSFFDKPVYHTGLVRPGQIPNIFNNWAEKPSWYKATKNPDSTWSPPVLFNNDMCCSMTHDHQTFVYNIEMPTGGGNIVWALRNPDGTWGQPQDFGPSINTASDESNPHLSFNGNMLVWTSSRPGGYGGNDLWMSVKLPDGSWAPAVNMGANVNTAEEEDQAWISVDNKRVYFNRGLTLMVTQNPGTGSRWTTPRALEFPASIEAGELSLTYDEQTLAMIVLNRTIEDAILSISYRQPDGTWSTPVPVD